MNNLVKPIRRAAGRLSLLALVLVQAACGGGEGTAGDGGQKQISSVASSAAPEASVNDIKVVAVTKVGEVRISRTVFDYQFRITVQNTAAVPFDNVAVELRQVGAGTTIIDGRVAVGSMVAGAQATPQDTVTVRHDRTRSFDTAALTWATSGTSADTPSSRIAALERTGAIPVLERTQTLAGVDANGNQVRDDVEAYVTTKYAGATAEQRAAVLQAARAMQAALLIDPSDNAAAKAANRKIVYAVHCIYARFDGTGGSTPAARVAQEIESLVTNTKPRLMAYLALNKALDGTSWAMPEGDSCE